MRITLFRDLPEEKRTSMEVYADSLRAALNSISDGGNKIKEFQPHQVNSFKGLCFLPLRSKIGNYYSRFINYPWQARRYQGDVNHIVDHGYGHLVFNLDPKRTIVTCHDLIPLKCKSGELPINPPVIATKMFQYSIRGMRKAARIIAVSENTKKDILSYVRCDPARIKVIYQGINSKFRKIKDESFLEKIRRKYSLDSSSPKLLHVGLSAYKNVEAVIQALAILKRDFEISCELITVGLDFTPEQKKLIDLLGVKKFIVSLSDVPIDDLVGIYNSADVLVFPSLYEGFGAPPLEAMACGTPVVASNVASLPEVVGHAAIMVDPLDYQETAAAVYAVLTNSELRSSLISKGLKRANRFTWEKTAKHTLEVYEEVYKSANEI